MRIPSVARAALCSLLIVALPTIARSAASDPTRSEVRYTRDIRPILSDSCFRCHGPDPSSREAKLRLDTFEDATAERRRGAAIVPGSAERSLLLERVAHPDADQRMPPADSGKHALDERKIALLREWIDAGAVYEPHWAFVPPVRPAVPEAGAASDGGAWARNEIDRFVLAELRRAGLDPAPEADRDTLLRRLFLDVTGLPPTPEELDAFAADERPDAFERWIERLFTEEPYKTRQAEHRATTWMDQARYADTSGIHMDAGRQTWLWRDWVLDAYRRNMPFDRFALEQLAGDLLPDATVEQQIASGFNRNHVTTDEGGAIAEEYLVEYAVDRVNTTSSVFLGLTMGCARCHDHKFDPLTQDDYYRLYAYFNSIDEPGLYSQLPDPQRAFEPFLVVPTHEQEARIGELRAERTSVQAQVDLPAPEDEQNFARFLAEVPDEAGVAWARSELVSASARGGAQLVRQPDDSVLATGANPDVDEHVFTLRTEAQDLRLLCLEALPDAGHFEGRVGRADNGNAVLSRIVVEARALSGEPRSEVVELGWAWADIEQDNGDFGVVNALDGAGARGWAVDGHRQAGGRVALFASRAPFGYAGGTELVVKLQYDSVYARHTFGRVRLSVGSIGARGLELLPLARSGWHLVGPFPHASAAQAYEAKHGPEEGATLEFGRNFGSGNQTWRFDSEARDARLNKLPQGLNVSYIGQRVFAPTARELQVSLGSDDGLSVSVAGREQHANRVDRALAADQDSAKLAFPAGESALVLKIVNTGGDAGFYHRPVPPPDELDGALVAALLPVSARNPELAARLPRAWRLARSPDYRAHTQRLAAIEASLAEIEKSQPRTMVMRELAMPRDTFVLRRGEYDKPDRERRVERGVPAALGRLPEDAPADRRGLVQWMLQASNPLFARVAANRLWESIFATGLVRTSEDFGLQGEWPSHPELLDWLAVELRDNGWDQQHLLRLMLSSATYRQASQATPRAQELDPDNRLLARAPRRRLSAEALRDQALYVSNLLVEQLGGPSVKPYQPEGLWQEIAMLGSNTRIYERGPAADLWRRSLYTYWKRACPPPALLTLDAPTREFCTVRRPVTNTPLQALVLWNDEQFVEAARALAERALSGGNQDSPRLIELWRRCTGRQPDAGELALLEGSLARFRERFGDAPEDAAKLVEIGASMRAPELDARELAAWTMLASAILNLDATITRS
ncbi:MAG: DUF1553 domain-containing protein [Planctomycetes bacterium]|nr:DUF1553 domain-containing protein [Planctomycetota bacterium]